MFLPEDHEVLERVAQIKYTGGGTKAELNHGYDAGSNRVYREDVAAAAQTTAVHVDELYGHDDLSRLDDLDIGDLSTSGTPSMASPIDQQLWTLDPQGNWSVFASDLDFASGISTLDPYQTRTHNDANEIDTDNDHTTTGNAIDEVLGVPASSDWVDPVYDAAGNMTKRPDPADQDDANDADTITYDAWNRVVKIADATTGTVATYEYDGLGRRIEKTVGSDTYDYYHNESWQVVEVRKNQDTDADPVEQFVYDTHYIDALVMRWYDANQDGTADEQYYLYDASFSVIALLDSQGTPLERYRYTPYGQRIVMDASFANPGGSSGYGQQRGFQGLLHDDESGLIENRKRMLDPLTGRFMQRDPLGYPDGMNAYAAFHVMLDLYDPNGTSVMSWLRNQANQKANALINTIGAYGQSVKQTAIDAFNEAKQAGIDAAVSALGGISVALQDEWRRDKDIVPKTLKLTYGFGYRIKVPEMDGNDCCARVRVYGFLQLEGQTPKIPQLGYSRVVVRGNGRLSYEFLVCPYSSPRIRSGEGSTFTFSLSGGLKWEIDGPDYVTGDLRFEVGGGYAWKWQLPSWRLLEHGAGAYARLYYERKSIWDGKRRWQVKVTIGQELGID